MNEMTGCAGLACGSGFSSGGFAELFPMRVLCRWQGIPIPPANRPRTSGLHGKEDMFRNEHYQ